MLLLGAPRGRGWEREAGTSLGGGKPWGRGFRGGPWLLRNAEGLSWEGRAAASVVERGPSGPCGDALAPVRCWIRAGPPGEGLVLRGWQSCQHRVRGGRGGEGGRGRGRGEPRFSKDKRMEPRAPSGEGWEAGRGCGSVSGGGGPSLQGSRRASRAGQWGAFGALEGGCPGSTRPCQPGAPRTVWLELRASSASGSEVGETQERWVCQEKPESEKG